jgi:hypothetical protein
MAIGKSFLILETTARSINRREMRLPADVRRDQRAGRTGLRQNPHLGRNNGPSLVSRSIEKRLESQDMANALPEALTRGAV